MLDPIDFTPTSGGLPDWWDSNENAKKDTGGAQQDAPSGLLFVSVLFGFFIIPPLIIAVALFFGLID